MTITMGMSSSRTKRTHCDVSHIVDEENVNTNFNKNRSIKVNNNGHDPADGKAISGRRSSVKNSCKKNKNDVSVKKKWSLKKSKSQCGYRDAAPTDDKRPVVNPAPLYRKKSSCVSCEDNDIVLGKPRSRSGSDKSLRFSDFNKVIRKTRIDEWQMSQPDIPLTSVSEPEREEICYICEVYTGSQARTCRVCCRAYHDSCLAKIGNCLLDKYRRLIACNKWSCHLCASLNHLLTQQEVSAMHEQLRQLDISGDTMTEADYVRFCGQSLQLESKLFTLDTEQAARTRFRSVAGHEPAVITDSQFLELESIRVLGRRCQNSLVHLLTGAELAAAKTMFQHLDVSGIGAVSRSAVQSLQLSMSRAAVHIPDESFMYMDEDLDCLVTWADFLKDMAIYFLGQRPNSEVTGSQGSIHGDGNLTSSSCGSLDVIDDRRKSVSQPNVPIRQQSASTPKNGCSVETVERQLYLPSGRSAMMEEINSEIDRCHCLLEKGEGHGAMHSNGEAECSGVPQLPSGLLTGSGEFPKLARTGQSGSQTTIGCWADTGAEASLDRARSSPYKDSRRDPIPWEDVETGPFKRGGAAPNTSRRSEVIIRRSGISSGEKQAKSRSVYSPGLVSTSKVTIGL